MSSGRSGPAGRRSGPPVGSELGSERCDAVHETSRWDQCLANRSGVCSIPNKPGRGRRRDQCARSSPSPSQWNFETVFADQAAQGVAAPAITPCDNAGPADHFARTRGEPASPLGFWRAFLVLSRETRLSGGVGGRSASSRDWRRARVARCTIRQRSRRTRRGRRREGPTAPASVARFRPPGRCGCN
jgi:hypothetical protein